MLVEKRSSIEWEGREFRHLTSLAWPIAVSMVSYALMTLVDTYFVSRLGTAEVAGVGLAGVLAFLAFAFPLGLARAVKVAVSQAIGAGNRDGAKKYLAAGIVLCAAIGFSLIGVAIVAAKWVGELATSPESGVHASEYFLIRMAGASPFAFVYAAIREYRYGIGDSKVPMRIAVVANVMNIGLDYLFIIHLGWGVSGAAWATAASVASQLFIMVAVQSREGFGLTMLRRTHLATIWRLGLPTGAQFVFEVGSFSAATILMASFGDVDMAAHQIAIQVIHFAFLPMIAFADAGSVLAGQAVGAGLLGLVRKVMKASLALSLAYAALWIVLFVFAGGFIADVFSEDPLLVARITQLLWLAAIVTLLDAFYANLRAILRGAGDVNVPATVGVAVSWASIPTLTWILGGMLGWGAVGTWVSICTETFVGSLILGHRFVSDRWHRAASTSQERLAADSAADAAAERVDAPADRDSSPALLG